MAVDLAAIPKVELHCHLDGILDAEILAELHAAGLARDLSVDELRAHTPVRTFAEFDAWARMHDWRIEGDIDTFRIVLARHIERLRAQNVIYAEIMIGSSEIPPDHGEMLDKVAAFRRFADGLERGETQVEFLVTFNRKKPAEAIEELAERTIVLHRAGLVAGVAMAGLERGNPARRFARMFARLRDEGVGIEIHAGEWEGAGSVVDALESGRPQRIGHGVAAFGDPALIERLRRDNVHMELCPTSNVCTGAVSGIEEHPLGTVHGAGVAFSINSDDPGAFGCDLTGELAIAVEKFGFSEEDLLAVARSALGARFAKTLRGRALNFQQDSSGEPARDARGAHWAGERLP